MAIPRTVGKYEIVDAVGAGGMGTVYRAFDPTLERMVALKIVHRDIKPSNLLVTRDGLVKITDFGIARIGPKTTTQTGLLVGTPQYMAPEQYMGGLVDHRCDLHAAGAVLYELLTGTPPFTGTSAEVMYKICNEVPKLLSAVDSSIPKALDAIVAKALEKIPANRYASAQEFQQALRSGWQAFSPKPPSPTLSQSARVIATAIHRQPVAAAAPRPAAAAAAPQASPGLQAVAGAGPLAGGPPLPPSPPDVAKSSPRSQPGADSHPGSLVAWSREQLAEIERQLIPLVGPMARILVREAAATTASRQELYRLLASHLRTPQERRQFLMTSERAWSGAAGDAVISGLSAGRAVTAEATHQVGEVLKRYLGPMGPIVARKCAQSATHEAHLYALLAEKVDPRERARFLAEASKPAP